jgi:hypothetical protein
MTSRVDVILLVVGTLHMTSRFSLLAPYPTERLDVILHQKLYNEKLHNFYSTSINFFYIWRNIFQWVKASSFTTSLDHTQRRVTVGRTPLDE